MADTDGVGRVLVSDPSVYRVWLHEIPSVVELEAPLSKSFFYRLGGLLLTGRGCVIGIPDAEDADSVVDILLAAGGVITGGDRVCLDYFREADVYEVDVRCSGGALRVTLPALLAAVPRGSRVIVHACSRLFSRLEEATLNLFQLFGRVMLYPEKGIILMVKERDPQEYKLVATYSSQPISGALLAAAVESALYDRPIPISLTTSVSRGHVYQTIEALRMARANLDLDIIEANGVLSVTGFVRAKQRRLVLYTQGDWGLASLLAPLAVHSKIIVRGLWPPWPGPGDHIVAEYLVSIGYVSSVESIGDNVRWILEASGDSGLNSELHVGDTPDIAISLLYSAAATNSTLRVRGVRHLALKESNRLESVTGSLRSVGYVAYHGVDYISVEGGGVPRNAIVECPGDHRIAMGVASLAAALGIMVDVVNPMCVSKSWRSFWSTISRLGVRIEPVE